jgi:hypothetical protein
MRWETTPLPVVVVVVIPAGYSIAPVVVRKSYYEQLLLLLHATFGVRDSTTKRNRGKNNYGQREHFLVW